MHTNLISSDPLLRANVPQNVWQYSNPNTWVDFLRDIMQKDCPEDLSYYLGTLVDYSDDYCKKVKRLFCQKYQYISAFHATKISSIDSFYTQGLIPLDIEQQNQRFIDIFQNYTGLNQPTLEQLNSSIDRCKEHLPYRENRIYLQIREQELLEKSAGYLLYGSEYLHILANEIKPSSCSYQKYLKNYGLATIFNIHVPIEQITNFDSFLFNLIAMVEDDQTDEDYPNDLSIHTTYHIKPKQIFGHYHPDTRYLIDHHES